MYLPIFVVFPDLGYFTTIKLSFLKIVYLLCIFRLSDSL